MKPEAETMMHKHRVEREPRERIRGFAEDGNQPGEGSAPLRVWLVNIIAGCVDRLKQPRKMENRRNRWEMIRERLTRGGLKGEGEASRG